MRNHSNLQNVQPEISNAVLTPDLIHPNFYKVINYASRCNYSSKSSQKSRPLTEHEKKQRKQWQKRQIAILLMIESNAVLGA